MNTNIRTTISAIAVLASLQAGGVMAEDRPKDIFVVADIAASNACFTNPDYQRKCLGQLVDKIDGLGLTYLDTLRLRPASSAASSATYWPDFDRDIEFVYRKAEPAAVPKFMAERFSELSKVAMGAEADFLWTMTEIGREARCATTRPTSFISVPQWAPEISMGTASGWPASSARPSKAAPR